MDEYGGCAFIYDTKKSFNSSKKVGMKETKEDFLVKSLNARINR